jgi:hypothetical protein
MDAVLPKNTLTRIMAKIMAGFTSLLGILWGLITYVFPDPRVFGFNLEFLNWKTIIIVFSVGAFMLALWTGWQVRRLPEALKGLILIILAVVLSGVFFKLGGEYAKPSFEFAKAQKLFTENGSTNLFGKRVETVDDVRIELLECEQNGPSPTCILELTNSKPDRDFRLTSNTSIFEEAGGALNLYQLRVGDSKFDKWDAFQLIRNVPTRLTLIFEAARSRVKTSPTLKLVFRDQENRDDVLKFNDVIIN